MEEGKVWFVTGAATGFGRAIVEAAAAKGAKVVATARDPRKLAPLADRAMIFPLDVTNRGGIWTAVEAAEHRYGAVDVLVNAAGYGLIAAVEEATRDEIDALFATHFTASLDLIRAVLPGMRERGRGHIVNFSSIAGFTGSAGTALYAAAKHAIEGLSEGLAKELAPLNIKVTIVEPGPFDTQFFTGSRKFGVRRMPDYDATAGAYRDRASQPDLKMPGDPVRGAAAILEAVAMDEPPLRLPLGRLAYEMSQRAYAGRIAETEQVRSLTLGADFPASEGRSWS